MNAISFLSLVSVLTLVTYGGKSSVIYRYILGYKDIFFAVTRGLDIARFCGLKNA